MATKKHTQNSLRLLKVKSNPDGTAERKRVAIGGGLLLEISSNGTKTWRLRYRLDDKPKMLWVGTFGADNDQERNIYTLAGAVAKAEELKNQIKKGVDPKREQEKIKEQAQQERELTFSVVAGEWLEVWRRERGGKAKSTIERNERLFKWLVASVPWESVNHYAYSATNRQGATKSCRGAKQGQRHRPKLSAFNRKSGKRCCWCV